MPASSCQGFSPWTLNLPDGVAPNAIRAQMVPLWTGEPPEDLVASAIAREDLNESLRARLRLMAGFYRTDAFLLVSMSRERKSTHLGLRLFVNDPEIVTRARLFNLGANRGEFPTKLRGIVSTLKPIRKARARQKAAVAAAPSPYPKPAPVRAAVPAAEVDRRMEHRAVPIDEQVEGESYGGSTPWYKSWWFWTITGVVVAGAVVVGVTVPMMQQEEGWTLVVQP